MALSRTRWSWTTVASVAVRNHAYRSIRVSRLSIRVPVRCRCRPCMPAKDHTRPPPQVFLAAARSVKLWWEGLARPFSGNRRRREGFAAEFAAWRRRIGMRQPPRCGGCYRIHERSRDHEISKPRPVIKFVEFGSAWLQAQRGLGAEEHVRRTHVQTERNKSVIAIIIKVRYNDYNVSFGQRVTAGICSDARIRGKG